MRCRGPGPESVDWLCHLVEPPVASGCPTLPAAPTFTFTVRTKVAEHARELPVRISSDSQGWLDYGDDAADRAKRASWTTHRSAGRVLLVKMRPEFAALAPDAEALLRHIDAVRYETGGPANRTYYGGHTDSWQRYTSELPVALAVEVNVTSEAGSVTYTTTSPLEEGALYAVVLRHVSGISEKPSRPWVFADGVFPFMAGACGVAASGAATGSAASGGAAVSDASAATGTTSATSSGASAATGAAAATTTSGCIVS